MKAIYKLSAALTVFLMSLSDMALAGSTRVDDFRNTNGAGTKKLDQLLDGGAMTAQKILDFVFIICTLVGVIIVAVCLYKLWDASKDETREKPKGAIIGLFIGGAMTVVGIITGIMANTMSL